MPPKRKPLPYLPRSVQAAEHLKALFYSGQLSEQLPSERALAAMIGVGRGTLRAALALLSDEGWALTRSRAGTKVAVARLQPLGRRRTVGIVLLMRVEQTSHRTLLWMTEVQRLLYRNEVDVEIYDGYLRKRNFFAKLNREVSHDCWLLIYPNQRALHWMSKLSVPAVVAGTVCPSYGVPSIDLHYRALCRHAAGRFVQLGHRRLAYIIQVREWGADLESIEGFKEGAALSERDDVIVSIEHHDGTRAGICVLADRLLARPNRPTAWLIGVAHHFNALQMHLLRRGVAIPEELSLISQDCEPWQFMSMPSSARYQADISTLAKYTSRQILKSLSGKTVGAEVHRLIPELHSGETLGPPPPSLL